MTTTARHYAEKVRSIVTRLDEHHANSVATLCQPEVSVETCRALQDARMTLEAELTHAAAQLASVVLAETTAHACSSCDGTDPASCWNNGSIL